MRNLRSNANVKRFLNDANANLNDHKINVIYDNTRYIYFGSPKNGKLSKWTGYFDETEIRVARKNPLWLEVFLHEYSHFLQYIEKDKTYMNSQHIDVDKLIDPAHFSKKNFSLIRGVEYNCEQRVLNLIDKYDLPIDKEKYAQRSNAYICYYHAVEHAGTFNTKKHYTEFCKFMPSRLQKSYVESIPKKKLDMMLSYFEKIK